MPPPGEVPNPIKPELDQEILKQITIVDAGDENSYPGVPEIWEKTLELDIPQQRIDELRSKFYPHFSDEEIVNIEKNIIFHFQKFSKNAKWVYDKNNTQPNLRQYNIDIDTPLAQRAQAINFLSDNNTTNTAFAKIDDVEKFFHIENEPTLRQVVKLITNSKPNAHILDVGSGGQAADIQLLADNEFSDTPLTIEGISAYDYGQNLRADFPEFSERLLFSQKNIYTDQIQQQADFIFSARTLPYTGVVDAVRFCTALHDAATNDGTIWVESVDEQCFDFADSPFSNLADYFDSLKEQHPTLKYRTDGSTYCIHWNKSEGNPFQPFIGSKIQYDQNSQRPYNIKYKPK